VGRTERMRGAVMTEEDLALAIDSGCDTVAAVELIRQRDAQRYAAVVSAAQALVRTLYRVQDWEGTPVDVCVDNLAKALFGTKGMLP